MIYSQPSLRKPIEDEVVERPADEARVLRLEGKLGHQRGDLLGSEAAASAPAEPR